MWSMKSLQKMFYNGKKDSRNESVNNFFDQIQEHCSLIRWNYNFSIASREFLVLTDVDVI